MTEQREFPVPLATDKEVAEFVARQGKLYDLMTDDYRRTPFVADIREGKNDPIYNAHSYHTKVPPRAIIPYILHYTDPGDIVLDVFCGTGMTGVAAMMCADPPEDILAQVVGAKTGARRVILNDLSPAACHIAYNYCSPTRSEDVREAFEKIKADLKGEFDWLYGTEHYEPATGVYDPKNHEVARRLKNSHAEQSSNTLLPDCEEERTWELLDRGEVERRLGPDVLARKPLPKDVAHFVRIPAVIQHTVWSDVYKCEGMVSYEEATGSINRKTGKPTVKKVRRPRGCGAELVLWDVAVDHKTGKVHEEFHCPTCGQRWKKVQLKRVKTMPVLTSYKYVGLRLKKQGKTKLGLATLKNDRRTTHLELDLIRSIEEQPLPAAFPTNEINTKGPQYNRNALSARKVTRLTDFYTKRNLRALAGLWSKASQATPEIRRALLFAITSAFGRIERMTRYVFKKAGNCSLRGQLYFPSFSAEDNVLRQVQSKLSQVEEALEALALYQRAYKPVITSSHAGRLAGIPDNSIDYVFTDPPFGSNIYYSEVNWLYECWLGKQTDPTAEAVVHRKNDRGTKTITDYTRLMSEAFGELYRVLKPGRFATIEFNNNDGHVFEAIKEAARSSGFLIENMLFLDKEQKTFKQIKGEKGEEDVVGHDVIFNLRKPAQRPSAAPTAEVSPNGKLEHLVADTIREHLRGLPDCIKADRGTYSDEHRTTPFLNTMLMNSILKEVNVERINLRFIDEVCGRYFKKIDQRWFLPEEVLPRHQEKHMYAEGFDIKDEATAIQWLHLRLDKTPLRIGELRPHWMKATVRLTTDLSTKLERLLRENFWLDCQTRHWRLPTDEERAQMNNVERLRAIHDAERFLSGALRPASADMEILGWIGHLYDAAAFVEQEAAGFSDTGEQPDLPAEGAKLYAMMPRLLQAVLKENVESAALARAQRQCRIAVHKVEEQAVRDERRETAKRPPTLFD